MMIVILSSEPYREGGGVQGCKGLQSVEKLKKEVADVALCIFFRTLAVNDGEKRESREKGQGERKIRHIREQFADVLHPFEGRAVFRDMGGKHIFDIYRKIGQNTTRRQKDDYASDARIAKGKEKFIEKIFFAVAKEQYGRGAHQEKRLLEHDSQPQKNAV